MKTARIIAVSFIFGALILVVATFLLRDKGSDPSAPATQTVSQTPSGANPPGSDNPFIAEATKSAPSSTGLESGHWFDNAVLTFSRLLLAVLLSGILAFRPRKDIPLFRRSLFVSQTQILLAVVAAALMLIVGDNTARAFAIFAAVSLVRFRTNIRDPKEITVLLISLALGLAAGVGQWALGISPCLFSLALLWLLEYNESENVFRAMELTVKTRDPDGTQALLKKMFKQMKLDAEVREFVPADEGKPIGSIVYFLNLRLKLSTDYVSDRIMAADPNIEGIQWSKSKGSSDIYQ